MVTSKRRERTQIRKELTVIEDSVFDEVLRFFSNVNRSLQRDCGGTGVSVQWQRNVRDRLTLHEILIKQDRIVLISSTISSRTFQIENLVELATVEEVLRDREFLVQL